MNLMINWPVDHLRYGDYESGYYHQADNNCKNFKNSKDRVCQPKLIDKICAQKPYDSQINTHKKHGKTPGKSVQ
ncbi:MAG: hypothetical protein Q8R26_00645 [bacterium]|nr:hypothetical protein [bacterium]